MGVCHLSVCDRVPEVVKRKAGLFVQAFRDVSTGLAHFSALMVGVHGESRFTSWLLGEQKMEEIN